MTELTRSAIALFIVIVSAIVLLASAVFGVYRGEFQALQIVWNVVQCRWDACSATTSPAM